MLQCKHIETQSFFTRLCRTKPNESCCYLKKIAAIIGSVCVSSRSQIHSRSPTGRSIVRIGERNQIHNYSCLSIYICLYAFYAVSILLL